MQLDHLLWEALTLEEGERRFTEMTGVTPSFGGVHQSGETHNSLLSLGVGVYLEIIALTPAHLKAANLPSEKLNNFKSGLLAFGVKADALSHVKALVENANLLVSSLREVARRSPDGHVLKWQTMTVGGHDFGDLTPFFTRFLAQPSDTLHPSVTSPKGCELLEFSVGHPNHRELSRLYDALQVDVAVFESKQPQLRAVLATPKGRVTLKSRKGF